MAPANRTSSPRDHVADANPDVARKKQRLSEDPGASPGDSVLIEACEPEDVGSNMDNAIEIDDDPALAMQPYSDDFVLDDRTMPYDKLVTIENRLRNGYTIDAPTFVGFSNALVVHLERTADDGKAWDYHYLDAEADFFTRVALCSLSVLESGSLFQSDSDFRSSAVHGAFRKLLLNLQKLCSRIIPSLPGAIKARASRRDSAQVSIKAQSLGSLWYIAVAAYISSMETSTLAYFNENLAQELGLQAMVKRVREEFVESGMITVLADLIRTLSGAMRELKDSWQILQHALRLFRTLVKVGQIRDQPFIGEVNEVMMVLKSSTLPKICEKHPGALPGHFHDECVISGYDALCVLVRHDEEGLASDLYERFVKSTSDAVLQAPLENDSYALAVQRACNDNPDILVMLLAESWAMQTVLSFIRSDIMEIRSNGISMMARRLENIWASYNRTPEGISHPLMQFAVRFLRQNAVTEYIFGPESHASLITRSYNIICYLAVTDTYTDAETDTIWRACTTSVEADFVKASFGVLNALLRHFNRGRDLSYLMKKYTSTPVARLGPHAIEFLPVLLRRLEEISGPSKEADDLSTAAMSFEILKHADSSELCVATNGLRQCAMGEIMRLGKSQSQAAERLRIYERCIPEIEGHTKHATVAVTILATFLEDGISSPEARKILAMLYLNTATEEFCHYVDTHRTSTPSQEVTSGILVRLSCMTGLMALAEATIEKTPQDKLFSYAFGESALSNEARSAAWDKLNTMTTSTRYHIAATNLWKDFVQDYAPSLSSDLATPQLINFMRADLHGDCCVKAAKDDYTSILKFTVWETLVRFATTAADDVVAATAVHAIIDILFDFPIKISVPPTSVARCHSVFARSVIQDLPALREDTRRIFLGINVLTALLDQSKATKSTYDPLNPAAAITLDGLDGAVDTISFTAQIYGPETQSRSMPIRARQSHKVSALLAKLSDHTGALQNRIIAGGAEITSMPDKSLSEAGVSDSGVILIRPRYTLDVDLDTVLTCAGPVEREVLAQYDVLDALLDGHEDVAQRVFLFLSNSKLSAHTRSKITSSETAILDVFPLDRPYRTRHSLFAIHHHLRDLTRLGIIDERFIARATHLLVQYLMDEARPLQIDLMIEVLHTLIVILQDSPQSSEAQTYLTEHQFCDRMTALLRRAKEASNVTEGVATAPYLRNNFASALYKALSLASSQNDLLWKEFTENASAADLHSQLLLDPDTSFSSPLAAQIRGRCEDTGTPKEIVDFYWRVIIPGLPAALDMGRSSEIYFDLAVDVLSTNKNLQNSETGIRELIEKLTKELWSYHHSENPQLLFSDKASQGLLRLLKGAITILKSHKKPLGFAALPLQLFQRFLFPPENDSAHRPLVNHESRSFVYDLMHSTLESHDDYWQLLDATCSAARSFSIEPTFRFSGHANYIRQPSQAAGLTNLGMTCYINSLIQQLFANLQFRKFVIEQAIDDPQKQDILAHVQALFVQMQNSTMPVADPALLTTALGVQTNIQEDVHTFYTSLLSRLEDNMPDRDQKALLTDFFTGQSITQVKGECGHVSSRTEAFTELSVTVNNKANLLDSLNEFVQGEPLEGANKYMCMSCSGDDSGRLVNAMKRTCLDKIPNSLTFCLKRFAFDNILDGENKVNDRFEFPKEINMSHYKREYLEDPTTTQDPDMFELSGVIVHQGSLSYGHYWSYVRLPNSSGPDNATWLYLEDSKTFRVNGGIQEVQQNCFGGLRFNDGSERTDSAYVLFYQRKSHILEAECLGMNTADSPRDAQILPRIGIPNWNEHIFHTDNSVRHKMDCLFDDRFTSLVTWLLDHYPTIVESRTACMDDTPTVGQPDAVNGTAATDAEMKISHLIVGFAVHIVLADPRSDKKSSSLTSSLTNILATSPKTAKHILELFSRNPSGFAAVARHTKLRTRRNFFDFLEMCMTCVREYDADQYDELIKLVVGAHASLLVEQLDATLGIWEEYFVFAGKIAQHGELETGLILDAGYLRYVFEVIYMSHVPEYAKKHRALYNWLRVNDINMNPLLDFVCTLLSGSVDLSKDPQLLLGPEDDRILTPNGWCLQHDELLGLLMPKQRDSRNQWLLYLIGSQHCSMRNGWQDYPLARLVGILVDPKVHYSIARRVEEFLLFHYNNEDMNLDPLFSMTLYFCLKRSDEDCRLPLKTFCENIVLFHSYVKKALSFIQSAYVFTPLAIMSCVPTWARSFLSGKRVVDRQEAAKWLAEHVFVEEPLSDADSTALDAIRIRTARAVTKDCIAHLKVAYNKEEPRRRHEAMLSVMEDAHVYFGNLQAEAHERKYERGGVGLTREILVECDEADATLAGVAQFLEDVSEWAAEETALPTRPIGGKELLEAESEEVESSDGDADGDGDSADGEWLLD